MRSIRASRHGVGLVIGLLGTLALLQLSPFLAYRRLKDQAWPARPSPEELRATAHQALGFWWGDPHDAFLVLLKHGDASSLPYLRRALASAPAPNDGGDLCTWKHGREALARILSRMEAKAR